MRAMHHLLAQGAWLHDLDPVLFPIRGSIAVRWYGLSYIAGFVVAWLVMTWMARRKLVLFDTDRVSDVILGAVIGVLVGGRLGYALFYGQHLLTDFSSGFPFWGLLDLTRGGMASHGGMIGLLVGAWWMGRREKVPALHILDALALVAPAGIVFGRLANFVNGELLGKVVAGPGEDAPSWAVRYPQELLHRPSPEQTAWMTDLLVRSGDEPTEQNLGGIASQLIMGVQSGSAEVVASVEPQLSARHPSQLYQAVAEGLIVAIVIWAVWRTPRRSGVISAWFLIVYGLGRIATEFIRLPDVGVATWGGLSRGQWLSTLMVFIGAALLGHIAKRSRAGAWHEPVGGWAHEESADVEDAGAPDDDRSA